MCVNFISGPLHRFPMPVLPHLERFNRWKTTLDKNIQAKGDNYIYNQIRICNKHFEDYYCSPSQCLTANAVPTLNLGMCSLISYFCKIYVLFILFYCSIKVKLFIMHIKKLHVSLLSFVLYKKKGEQLSEC